jgi:CBS domain-containing protein
MGPTKISSSGHRDPLAPDVSDEAALQVRHVMTFPVFTIDAEDPVSTACALMGRHNVGALPVRRGGKLCGIITRRDVAVRACAQHETRGRARVGEVMTHELSFVPPDWPLFEAAKLMNRLKVHRLAVIDGDLRLVGMLSISDLPAELRSV